MTWRHHRAVVPQSGLTLTIIMVVVVLALYALWRASEACEARGGVLVRTVTSVACVQVTKR